MEKPNTVFEANLPAGFLQPSDEAGRKLLREYGAVFVARGGAVPPDRVVFEDEAEISVFQSGLKVSSAAIGGFELELQAAAMERLEKAIEAAALNGLSITPRSGDSARRRYKDTVGLWASRVGPALVHWVAKGRLEQAEADRIRELSPFEQVPEIFALEAKGMYCAKDLSKSIIYSVAPPGASQHLSMLAFDVSEFDNPQIRVILASHYWYQTVVSDLPHFTFLGVPENELPALGLRKVVDGERRFWLPDLV